MFSWRVRYTINLGHIGEREHDINIDDPSDNEILNSPLHKEDIEATKRNIVRLKADEIITKYCNRISVETDLGISYELKSQDYMEDGVRKYSIVEGIPVGMRGLIGPPLDDAYFSSLDQKISTYSDDLDYYADLYNWALNSSDIFYKYILLYRIAENEINSDKDKEEYLALRVIRNMLSHQGLEPKYKKQCIKADELFGFGVRRIHLSNLGHQKVVQDNLPQLMRIARSVINQMQPKS